MRKALLGAAIAALSFGVTGATAAPPDDDPTCDNAQQTGAECAGDNGAPGCQGINTAEPFVDENAGDAFDLVTDILDIGDEGDCK